MNINKRERLLGILAIGAVAFYAAVSLVLLPLAHAWTVRAGQIAKLKEGYTKGMVLVDREQSIRTQWDNMRTNTFASAKPEAESQMFKAFDRWAQDTGVTVGDIRPQWKETEDEYKTLECRAIANGDLAALTRFLYRVEKEKLAVKVDTMEITARDNNGQQLSLVLQVNGLLLNPPKR